MKRWKVVKKDYSCGLVVRYVEANDAYTAVNMSFGNAYDPDIILVEVVPFEQEVA